MWTKGAVVIIKRGDEAIGTALENGWSSKAKDSKKTNTMERDYNIMKVGRENDIQYKIRKANNKYGRRPTKIARKVRKYTKPLLIAYAIVCYCSSKAWRWAKTRVRNTLHSERTMSSGNKHFLKEVD